ncbi:hypothetical protein DPEC_G00199020 [Dallia pectoralis]|uniref:Uncharacterized protein n=1 Tax=Dallia pectoralis TaxID=75939 RepID=A0ACC2G8B3_DALPE|nr:hypothetical protein DPEC_G00199020 [Dallia pectoralis]
MRPRDFLYVTTLLVVILVIWGISTRSPSMKKSSRNIQNFSGAEKATAVPKISQPKCNLPKTCPLDHYAFSLKSGATNNVGPRICFDGKIIMSGVRNNIGKGLNIVLVNAENGTVEDFRHFDMYYGNPDDTLAFLKKIKPGTIVLVASFDDAATKMVDEIRDLFVGFGSSKVKDIKFRDTWVFAGAPGTKIKSPFEKSWLSVMRRPIYMENGHRLLK